MKKQRQACVFVGILNARIPRIPRVFYYSMPRAAQDALDSPLNPRKGLFAAV